MNTTGLASIVAAVALLTEPNLHARVSDNAAALVRTTYCADRIVPLYEAAYLRVLGD